MVTPTFKPDSFERRKVKTSELKGAKGSLPPVTAKFSGPHWTLPLNSQRHMTQSLADRSLLKLG